MNKEDQQFLKALMNDLPKHTEMSPQTRKAIEKIDKGMENVHAELRRLSDNDIRRNENLKMILQKLDKFDDSYATKEEVEMLRIEYEPVKKVVYRATAIILLAVLAGVLSLIIIK